jgi:Transposase DDE domain
LLRCQARERAGRLEDPTAVVLDTQSIRAANHVLAATTGKDAGNRAPGRKRGMAVDALGLIIAVVVAAASVTDNTIGTNLLEEVVEHLATVTRVYVDAGFKDDVMIHGAVHGIAVEQVKRSDTRPGFLRVAHRWVVERTHGTLMLHGRLTAPPATCRHRTARSTEPLTSRSSPHSRPATAQCAPRTSATRSASAPNPRTPKASAPS